MIMLKDFLKKGQNQPDAAIFQLPVNCHILSLERVFFPKEENKLGL